MTQAPAHLLKLFDDLKAVENEVELISSEIKELQSKKKKLDLAVESFRSEIINVFVSNDKTKLNFDGIKANVRRKPPKPIITDQSKLDEKFFEYKKTLSKTLVNEAWANGERPEGVALDNGGYVLTIKREDA